MFECSCTKYQNGNKLVIFDNFVLKFSHLLSRYFRHDFVELHRVLGVSGVYIATNLTEGVPKKRHLQSWITFNKGGEWTHLRPPPELCVGKVRFQIIKVRGYCIFFLLSFNTILIFSFIILRILRFNTVYF